MLTRAGIRDLDVSKTILKLYLFPERIWHDRSASRYDFKWSYRHMLRTIDEGIVILNHMSMHKMYCHGGLPRAWIAK